MLCNFQIVSRLIFHEDLRNVSQFGYHLSTVLGPQWQLFEVWGHSFTAPGAFGHYIMAGSGGYCDGVGGIVKMALICRPLWVPFGGRFQTFFGQKSFGKQKSCHCKPHGAGTCESHESCRKTVIPEPSDWSSRCSGSSIYTIPFDPRKCQTWPVT